jgi:hypothetical protein
MRLFAMHPWTNLVTGSAYNDIQWRYDELNNQLQTKLTAGPLTLEAAKETIDFLTPDPAYGKFPTYYNPPKSGCLGLPLKGKPNPDAWKTIPIKGAVSLMDLKNKVIHSHYGYYGDKWVQIHLKNYFP